MVPSSLKNVIKTHTFLLGYMLYSGLFIVAFILTCPKQYYLPFFIIGIIIYGSCFAIQIFAKLPTRVEKEEKSVSIEQKDDDKTPTAIPPDYVTVQFDFYRDKDLEILRMGQQTGLSSRLNVINYSLGILQLCIREVQADRIIASVDEKTLRYRELLSPALLIAKGNAQVDSSNSIK